jgi:hypothetical protein
MGSSWLLAGCWLMLSVMHAYDLNSASPPSPSNASGSQMRLTSLFPCYVYRVQCTSCFSAFQCFPYKSPQPSIRLRFFTERAEMPHTTCIVILAAVTPGTYPYPSRLAPESSWPPQSMWALNEQRNRGTEAIRPPSVHALLETITNGQPITIIDK